MDDNYELINLNYLPTTTSHQARLRIYQPTRKPIMCARFVPTPWGTATITGKIGQGHADVMEAIFRESFRSRFMEDGSMQILVDPHKVRLTACGGLYQLSHKRLDEITTDLMQTVIDMSIPGRDYSMDKGVLVTSIEDSIIDAIPSPKARSTSFNIKNRKMWRVDLGRHYVRLIEKDIKLYYDPRPIARLNSGVAQAVARHLLTHSTEPNGGWIIDNVIEAVGANPNKSSKTLWERRNEIKEDEEGFKKMGLIIEDERIRKI